MALLRTDIASYSLEQPSCVMASVRRGLLDYVMTTSPGMGSSSGLVGFQSLPAKTLDFNIVASSAGSLASSSLLSRFSGFSFSPSALMWIGRSFCPSLRADCLVAVPFSFADDGPFSFNRLVL